MPFIQKNSNGIILKVFVQPRSSKNMIAGQHGDALKIKVTAPPVDDAANKMCVQYLAKWFKVPKSSIEIISGHTSRTKRLLLRYKNEKNASGSEQKRIRSLISSL
ncbi:MAG: DUF167 domain-containing protein, partial [Desulfobacteraceae bacterium]|nr:DUF167 domain-containing protein [Desulfobacteraceae bacterium]